MENNIKTDLFSRLKRLFSTNNIIRNVGGKQLRVIDTERIQSFGNLKTNALVDRFTRLHRYGANTPYNPTMNYQTLRIQLYTDYEAMDTEPIIASTLDIVADECTIKNESGEILQIRSADENTQKILYNLFYDVLNIEFNLWAWTRQMCKYGDLYLHLDIVEKFGIYNISPLSVYDMVREEGYDEDNPNAVRFRVDPMVLQAGGYTPKLYDFKKDSEGKITFDNYEIAHFRLYADANYLPYGRSYVEPARKVYKQYCLDGDTKVWSKDGYKLIKNIIKGDEIISYNIEDNKYETTKVINSLQTGIKEIYKISTAHRTLHVTEDHPILTENLNYKQVKNLSLKDRIAVSNNTIHDDILPNLDVVDENKLYVETNDEGKKYLNNNKKYIQCKECGKFLKTFNSGAHLKTHNITINEYKEKWGENSTKNITYDLNFINNINKKARNRLKLSVLKEGLNNVGLNFNKNHYNLFYKKQQTPIIDISVLNKNIDKIVELFGFMLGDGWIIPNTNNFCFSLGDKLNKSFKYYEYLKEMGFEPWIQYENTTKAQVNLSNYQLVKIFKFLEFKTGTYNKIVPKWVYSLPYNLKFKFIEGFTNADGCKVGENSYQIGGNNKNLIEDLQHICQTLGMSVTNVHIQKPKDTYRLYNKTFYKKNPPKEGYAFKYTVNSNLNNVVFEKIRKIQKLNNRKVYDIEVESPNHNFIADGLIVHNCLMKDAMMLHRITRAPEKRAYYVNVGNIPANEVDAYMQKLMQRTKKTPYIDPTTGEYNLKYNMQNMTEDFYIPVRGQNDTTKIDTIRGLEYNAIEDVQFLRDEMLSALKVPKAFFGFEKDLCVSPDTKIPLLDGRVLTVLELINEYNQGKQNYVYSLDENTNNIVPGEIEWAGFTRRNAQTVKVWLDNNNFIQCTPDHNFLTRNGEWKEAQYLTKGEPLMPLYFQKSTDKKINGYEQVYVPSTGKYEYVHRLVAGYYNIKQKGKVIHHKDCNKLNNNPENLDGSMNFWEHRKWHIEHTQLTHTPEANEKRKNTYRELIKNEEFLLKRQKICKENSKQLVKWIKKNGSVRKGTGKNIQTICKGCGKEFINNNSIDVSFKTYCSVECRKENWKAKSKNISLEILIENAKQCKNFKELKNKINIKDSSTLSKIFKKYSLDKSQFIIKYMPKAHKNYHFMSQFPETNKYYIDNFNPSQNEYKLKYNYKNHTVTDIEWVEEKIDTCDLTIKKYHNFGTEAGVIIHNSGKATLAAEDIRFARTIDRIQRILLSELYKIAYVHLYTQGYDGEALTNFELNLTNPSIVFEQEKVALWKEKMDLANNMIQSNLLSSDYIYDQIFQLSEDQYDEVRDTILEDKKRLFRWNQIENEGNDPAKSGVSYGTPHDLASLYGKGRKEDPHNVPPGYDETKLGRPKEKASMYGTQKDPLGKDRMGRKEMTAPAKQSGNDSDSNTFKGGSPLSLSEYKKHEGVLKGIPKDIIFKKDSEKIDLLNEENIKDI